MESLTERDKRKGEGYFRGNPIRWVGPPTHGMWVYADTLEPTPGFGGEARPCARCGQKEWSGNGGHDQCLGLLPGVMNAYCGHGIAGDAYIQFENGIVIRGFAEVIDKDDVVILINA